MEPKQATGRKPSQLTVIHHFLLGWPLAEVVAGLAAQDPEIRVDAAKRLSQVLGKTDQSEMMAVAFTCLTDPLPAVRYYAIRALAGWTKRDDRLVALLGGGSGLDAQLRASVLSDIAAINGPDSPFHGNKQARKALAYSYYNKASSDHAGRGDVIRDALVRAQRNQAALPILEAAKAADMTPYVYAHWSEVPQMHLVIGPWPNRCCVCGASGPSGQQSLSYSGLLKHTPTPGGWTNTTVKGTIGVPVCAGGQCRPNISPLVQGVGLLFKFPSPQFTADLLGQEAWHVF
ncbi:MAG: hypothetical protein ABSB34_13400 [Candidatus Limnocylindrales bacterium]|jgi:hypothetical protein